MSEDTVTTTVSAVAELSRQAETWHWDSPSDDHPVLVARLRDGETLSVQNLEAHLQAPLRARGTAVLHDPHDWAQYVNRLHNPAHTTVWADVKAGRVFAVIDDHADYDEPGWRSHTVGLHLQPDEDWRMWLSHSGRLMGQAEFAERIEELRHTIVRPDAADMLEVATTLQGKRSVVFKSGTRLQTGDVQLTFEETTQARAGAAGKLEIPETFVVRIAPWMGVAPVELEARLRYRIDGGGHLDIGYQLLRADRALVDAFAGVITLIREELSPNVPVLMGVAPQQVTPNK